MVLPVQATIQQDDMPATSIHALPLAALLRQATDAPDVCEPAGATFSSYDRERLLQLCQTETLYCDQPVQHLVITARKGGYLKGNYCQLAGLLYLNAGADPVASLEIRFSAYLDGPEIYVQSLRSPFTWRNDYAQLHADSPAIAPHIQFERDQFEFEEGLITEPRLQDMPLTGAWQPSLLRSET